MRITFLGTGTSVGVPIIGCDCPVCVSTDPRNRRRRTSIYLEAGDTRIVVDTPPDFRDQALQFGLRHVDAVLFTHSHADHIFGFDDIRRFNTIQNSIIPAYGSPATIADLRRIFNYVHTDHVPGVYRPRTEFREITGPFMLGAMRVEPLAVDHGGSETFGFLFECDDRRFAYVPDCRAMDDALVTRLSGVDLMVLDALRDKPHRTHLTLEESVMLLRRIGAKRSYVIHLCHDLDHEETQRRMPPSMHVSYDGLVLHA